ncbi:MAG: hypothetical protein QXW34_02215 [Candidatus Methanomethyliaceae archaeon]
MSDNVYPKFSLDTSNVYPKITLIGLKEAVHFTTLTALEKIAEIQGVAGYSRPPQYVNAQVDSFWVSGGVWGTVESTNTYYSTPYRSLVFKTLLTTDEPINSLSLTVSGYSLATIIPWDNKVIFAKVRYQSGGYVYCDYLIHDANTGQQTTKSVLLYYSSSITNAGGIFIVPAGPKHFGVYFWYYITSYFYSLRGVNYETNTVTFSTNLYGASYQASLRYVLCRDDGYCVNIIFFIDYTSRYYSKVIENGTSLTDYSANYFSDATNIYRAIFILRNGIPSLYMANNYKGGDYYVVASVSTYNKTSYVSSAVARAPLSAPCIIDKNRIMNIYLYANRYYAIGFNVNDGSIIGEIDFGTSPPSGYYFPGSSGFGRAELWSDNLFVGSVAYFGGNWYKCIAGDTTKLIWDYTSSVPEGIMLVGKNVYQQSYNSSTGEYNVKWQDLSQTYVIFRDDSYLRTKAFNMIKPSSKAVIHAEGIGYLSAPIPIQILDENNNKIGEGNIYDEVELSQTVNKAKLLVKGNNQRYNFLMLFSYGVLYE